jgi:hypothetical protein
MPSPDAVNNAEIYFRVEFMRANPGTFYQTPDGSWRIRTAIAR